MKLGESFVGKPDEHGSHSGSLEGYWIDLRMEMDDSGDEPPRNKIVVTPKKRNKNISCTINAERALKRTYLGQVPSLERTAPDNIIHFWEGLFQVADAISRIHHKSPHQTATIFQGWHQDVKPANILWTSNSSRQADETDIHLIQLGEAQFRTSSPPDKDWQLRDEYGTCTYGACEHHKLYESTEKLVDKTTPSIDLWSLGCMFSEAAVLLVARIDRTLKPSMSKVSIYEESESVSQKRHKQGKKQTSDGAPVYAFEGYFAPQSHIDWVHILDFLHRAQSPDTSRRATAESNWRLLKAILESTINKANEVNEDGVSARISSSQCSDIVSPQVTETGDPSLPSSLPGIDGPLSDHRPLQSSRPLLETFSSTTWQESHYVLSNPHAAWLATNSVDEIIMGGSWSHCISSSFQKRKLPSRTSGTGDWLLKDEQFVRWQNKPEGIFWMTGSPGCGKSALTAMVFETLESDRQDGEYFVNFRSNPDFKGPSTVAGILWEILIQAHLHEPADKSKPDLHAALSDLVYTGDRLSSSRMKHIFSKIIHCLKGHETLCLFVDGLSDFECQNERDLLYELFDYASRSDPHHRIKLFISSSPGFFGTRGFGSSLRVDLDTHPKTKEDLALYVKSALQSRTLDQDSENFSKRLLNQNGSSFLRAELILQSTGLAPAAENPLKHIFRSMSTDLYTFYANLLGQIEKCNHEISMLALSWLVYAARPLHSIEMVGALNMQTGIELHSADIVQICGGLIAVDENNILRFIHYSVREFLESSKNGNRSEAFKDAHEMIADTCLKTMYPQGLLQSLRLPTQKSTCLATENGPRHRQSLLSYACRYWIFHYKLAEPSSSYIAGLLHKYLGKCFSSLDLVNTALWVGARYGFPKLVRLELDMGANINLPFGPEENTPLIWAVNSGHLDTVKLLLEYGADPRIPSGNGFTPLMLATAIGRPEIVELLLDRVQNCVTHYSEQGLSSTSRVAESVTQELSLETIFSEPCITCGAVETGYQLSIAHKTSLDNDAEILPPITVKGEYISRAEMELLTSDPSLQRTSPFLNKSKKAGKKRNIKWFPGAKMHRSLEIAAKRGIEDFKRLLVAVGNDINDLESSMSVSKLVTKMRIS